MGTFLLLTIFFSFYGCSLAFYDACGCNGTMSYDLYEETCTSLRSSQSLNENNYELVSYTERGSEQVDFSDKKLRCDGDIMIFIGNAGHRNTDDKFFDKIIGDIKTENEIVLSLTWGLGTNIKDCGDLQSAIVSAGKYLLKSIRQLNTCGSDIENIRIVTLGTGFYVAMQASNAIARLPQKTCFKYVAGIQPTKVPLSIPVVSCKSIAIFDNPGECSTISPLATVNIKIGNNTCENDDPDCQMALPDADVIIGLFKNHKILYKSESWEDALASRAREDKIKVHFSDLSSGYYLTDPTCATGNVNMKTIKNSNNLVVVDTGPFDSYCGCENFDSIYLDKFCSVRPNIHNASSVLTNEDYYLKTVEFATRNCTLNIDVCPQLTPDQEVLFLIGDAIDETADHLGNAANEHFYNSFISKYSEIENVIGMIWTYDDQIKDCKDLSRKIQEAGYYLSLFLTKFNRCNIPYSKLSFVAFGNGNHVLSIALDLIQSQVNKIIEFPGYQSEFRVDWLMPHDAQTVQACPKNDFQGKLTGHRVLPMLKLLLGSYRIGVDIICNSTAGGTVEINVCITKRTTLCDCIRPTNFPVTLGPWAKQSVVVHQKPGTCSTKTESPVNVIVNDPAVTCSDDQCNYGFALVDYVLSAIKFGISLYTCESWAAAIANIPSSVTPVPIEGFKFLANFYITNLSTPTAICPSSTGKRTGGLLNLNLGLLNGLL